MTLDSPPTVSVVIPVYNGDRYLAEAITSVLDQTYKNFELIVVDDGSTDGSAEIAKSYKQAVLYTFQPNGGLSKARNTGLALARGKYIAFLDHDDLWLPHKLARQVTYLDSHPDVGVVYSQCHMVREGHVPAPVYREPVGGDPLSIITAGYGLQMSVPMFRKSVFEKAGGFDEAFLSARGYEDIDMTIRLSEVTAFAYIPEVLVLYRLHESNLSDSPEKSQLHVHNRGIYLHKCLDRYRSNPQIARTLYHEMVGYWSDLGKLKLMQCNVAEGRQAVVNALRLSLKQRTNAKIFVRTLSRFLRSYLMRAPLKIWSSTT